VFSVPIGKRFRRNENTNTLIKLNPILLKKFVTLDRKYLTPKGS